MHEPGFKGEVPWKKTLISDGVSTNGPHSEVASLLSPPSDRLISRNAKHIATKNQPCGIKSQQFLIASSLCRTKSQSCGIKPQQFLITASLCRTKNKPCGIKPQQFLIASSLCRTKKSTMWDKTSTIFNSFITVQNKKVNHVG